MGVGLARLRWAGWAGVGQAGQRGAGEVQALGIRCGAAGVGNKATGIEQRAGSKGRAREI